MRGEPCYVLRNYLVKECYLYLYPPVVSRVTRATHIPVSVSISLPEPTPVPVSVSVSVSTSLTRMVLCSLCMYQMHFVCTFACPARPAAGSFSRSRLRGTQGARVHHGASVGPGRAPSRALWASTSRAIRQVLTGSLSASPSLAEQWNPKKYIRSIYFLSDFVNA